MTIQIFDILDNAFWRKRVLDTIPEIIDSNHMSNHPRFHTLRIALHCLLLQTMAPD